MQKRIETLSRTIEVHVRRDGPFRLLQVLYTFNHRTRNCSLSACSREQDPVTVQPALLVESEDPACVAEMIA